MKALLSLGLGFFLVVGCGSDSGGGNGDGVDSGAGGSDGSPSGSSDGGPLVGCTPGSTECTDCIDNDGDGRIDGFDVECISAADNDEGSFATGIPGDNQDPNKQDCFFDGNSGRAPMGMDDCIYDTCCLLGNCEDGVSCAVSQECVDFCAPSAPPCCDCFGCCTICDDQGCVSIVTNLSAAPDCDGESIHDESKCPRCALSPDCASPPDPDGCLLCPGQDASDLPSTCGGMQACPEGIASCQGDADCESNEFCSNGCCISQIIVL